MEVVESDGCHRFTCISIFHHGVLLFESLEFGPTSDGIEGGDQNHMITAQGNWATKSHTVIILFSLNQSPTPHVLFITLKISLPYPF